MFKCKNFLFENSSVTIKDGCVKNDSLIGFKLVDRVNILLTPVKRITTKRFLLFKKTVIHELYEIKFIIILSNDKQVIDKVLTRRSAKGNLVTKLYNEL